MTFCSWGAFRPTRPKGRCEPAASCSATWCSRSRTARRGRIRDGVSEAHFESWPRIDDAIGSYGVFRELRDEGVIGSHVRFQVCLPFCTSGLNGFKADFAHDFPIAQRAYEDLFARELRRLTAAIPAEDLALQWDVCWEVLDLEGVIA